MTGSLPHRPVVIDPTQFDAVIFDMDGVVTDTASTHAAAWSRLFDEYLTTVASPGTDPGPFTPADYRAHVDGRARIDGVETFLASRGIALAWGTREDPPGDATAWALANRKNAYFLDALDQTPPAAFPSSVALVEALQTTGVAVAVVTASANRAEVLAAAGLTDLFGVHVDGHDAAALGLAGKPDPALFVEAARRLGVDPRRAVVVEDATAGVQAGRRGGFGLVIGVDRTGNPGALQTAGADVVVTDLDQVTVAAPPAHVCRPAGASEWHFGYEGFAPAEEGRREALLTLGNGVFATRAAAPEATAGPVHYPGTYAAGFYNRLRSRVDGRESEHESMVNLPDWLPLSFRPDDGDWLDLTTMHVADYRQDLDLRHGILRRSFEVTDTDGRTTQVAERRLVHMATPHLAALEWVITPQNWSGLLEVRSGIDGTVENRNVTDEAALAARHLTRVVTGAHKTDSLWLSASTTQSERRVALACRTRIDRDGHPSHWRVVEDGDRIEQHTAIDVTRGQSVCVVKIAALRTSLDHAIADVTIAALADLDDAAPMEVLVASHESAWEQLWQRAHLDLHCDDPEVSRTLNLHTFHVVQTLPPHIVDRDVGVPARGLTGEGYRGHVFWDELFVFPYLNLRFPSTARELLLYRYRRLPAARRMAAAMGCRGARFPWQSGSDGREKTPTEFYNPRSGRWMADNSRRQHHVSLAVAYELWQYHQVTGDDDFLVNFGAELLVEIARFWVDLAEHDPVTGRWSIRGVMGPDEFHDGYPDRPGDGIDDNAYTNVMVSWLLRRALDTHRLLGDGGAPLWDRLALEPGELDVWDRVSRRLQVPFHGDGMISQFAGYEGLAELDWAHYRDRYGNIGRLDLILEAEGDTTNRYKAAKQADVLMLLYLFSAEELTDLFAHLGYRFDPAVIPAMVDYYTARMTHGSTLCRVTMAWVLARTDRARSWGIFRDAQLSDVADIQGGTTREGVHLGAMAGTLDLVQRCYTGLEIRDGTVRFNPRLPDELTELRFGFRYRNQHVDAAITHDRLELRARPEAHPAAAVTVVVAGRVLELQPRERVAIDLPPRHDAATD
ncbi:MAG: beta-phosphoglucomutase family hydrolase [Sporichthyaceae bacterium]